MRLFITTLLASFVFGTFGADVKTLNTLRTFPRIETRKDWEAHAKQIRQQALVSCGLMPMPEKTALNAQVFGKIEREGYSIEKVYFESLPGFYVAGNLYRPLGKKGPFPAILNPHGHWTNGRMADEKDGSIAARCINFARQGMIAFSWDMVGYNDTTQVSHKFAAAPENQLWNISLMGLQTWNTIRALDFLETLPDVDKKRLACTGESGGGTQTFMLGAVDDRPAVLAPIVMVSHSMQGGCLCENAPGLRVEYSNMEIAAAPAPKPQILVAASGDWTKATMTVEGPAIESIYKLFRAENNFDYALFDYPHNYNQTSREAVYQFFGKHLLRHREPGSLKEESYKKEPDTELRVFPDGKLPRGALTEPELIAFYKDRSRKLLEDLSPVDKKSADRFAQVIHPLWKHSLQLDLTLAKLHTYSAMADISDTYATKLVKIANTDSKQTNALTIFEPTENRRNVTLIMVHPQGTLQHPSQELIEKGYSIATSEAFVIRTNSPAPNYSQNYYTTYNRTDLQKRVQDLVTTALYLKSTARNMKVVLYGVDQGAIWSMLAAPVVDGIVADLGFFDNSDSDWMKPDYFTPGAMAFAGVDGALALSAPTPVLLSSKNPLTLAEAAYEAKGAVKNYSFRNQQLTDEESLKFLTSFR